MNIDEGEGTLATVTQLVNIASENYVDIPLTNVDDGVELYDGEEINERFMLMNPTMNLQ